MELIVGLDAATSPARREFSPTAVASIAAAAGADAFHATFRLDSNESLRERDMVGIREAVDRPVFVETVPSIGALRPLLTFRPDAVILGPERQGDVNAVLDPTLSGSGLDTTVREARAAGMPVYLRIAAQLSSVRAAHRLGVRGVVFPAAALAREEDDQGSISEATEEAVRAAAKLRLLVLVGPLDALAHVGRVRTVAPKASVILGNSLIDRAALLGLADAIQQARSRT